MKASEILDLWRPVAAAFGYRSTAWLKMLRIAEAGAQGLTMVQLSTDGGGVATDWKWLKKAEAAGLIEIIPNAVPHSRGGKRSHLLKITDEGLKKLGLN